MVRVLDEQVPMLRVLPHLQAVIDRPRLAMRIQDSMKARVTIITAPAGFGKTIALSQTVENAVGPHVRCDLNAQLDTLFRFVSALSRSVAPLAPSAALSFTGAYDRALQTAKPEHSLAAWLHEHLKHVHATIVVDQLHYVRKTDRVAQFLTALVEETARHIRWVFVTREDIGLPIPRWMSEGIMELPVDAHALRFSFDDVARAAELTNAQVTTRQLKAIYAGTAGWPMGVMFALRGGQLISGAESYNVLSDRIFADRAEREQDFLLSTCLLPTVDGALCRAAGWTDANGILRAMDDDAPFIFVRSHDTLQYHDAFAEYLQSMLRKRGASALGAVLEIAAGALAEIGNVAESLCLYTRFEVVDEVARLLTSSGLHLLEQGHAEIVQEALALLDLKGYQSHGVVLAIKAVLEGRSGRFDTFLAFFMGAIGQIDDPLQAAELTYLYACELIRQRHAGDCIDLLTPIATLSGISLDLRASISSVLAEAYMVQGDSAKANDELGTTMLMVDSIENAGVLARIYGRAAFIALYSQRYTQSREWALKAEELAKACGQFNIAAGVCTVLYACAFDADDDPKTCLRYLAAVAENGLKGGNPWFEMYALINAYELQVERADVEAIDELGRALRSFDVDYGAPEALEALLPSEALRATWNGDFLRAYHLLAPSAVEQEDADRRGLRWAEIALYAVAAGLVDAAEAALDCALSELRPLPPSVRTFRAKALLAFVLHKCSREAAAREQLEELARMVPSTRCGALLAAIAALCDGSDMALDALSDVDAAGIAKMFRAFASDADATPAMSEFRAIDRKAAGFVLEVPMLDEIDAAINDLIVKLEAEFPLMAEHSRAVSRWCAKMARKLGLSQNEITFAARAGLIHDIGKIKTPPEILNAARALDAREWKIMRSHSAGGAHLLKDLPLLAHLIPPVRSHHERIDGKGYPDGLRAGSIPFIARLVSVADCFNAMIGRRPYRDPMLPSDALSELVRQKGRQFDPELVDAMVAIVDRKGNVS